MTAEHYRVLVVDDEKAARIRLLELLSKQANTEVVGVAGNVRKAVEAIRTERPDLVFLDIQMPGQDGFKVISEVGSAAMPLTIFVTAYEQFAIQAFDVRAVDYLLKPFSDARFEQAFQRAKEYLQKRADPENSDRASGVPGLKETQEPGNYLERIVLRANGSLKLLEADEIDWIEAAGVYVNLHQGAKVYLHRSSIAYLADRLDPKKFIRVSRSALVNTLRVRELRPRTHGEFTIILKDGTELSLNRGYRARFELWLRQSL